MRGEITLSGDLFRWGYNDNEVEDTHSEYLSTLGYNGTSKSWEGVIYGLIKKRNPNLEGRVKIVAEGDEIAVYSPDKGSLEHLQSIVTKAKEDDQLFNEAVREAVNANKIE